MGLLATDAVVLHVFDYLETSRIYRLLTRDAGIHSVLARGARRSRSRYGSAVDLFAEGEAQLMIRPTRDLQTLVAFDVTRARSDLAASLERFTAAAAISELALRFARDDAQPALYAAMSKALDAIAAADGGHAARSAALGGAWHVVAELGFAPALDICSACHRELPPGGRLAFSHPLGGALCGACAAVQRSTRTLPPEARSALRAWVRGEFWAVDDVGTARAHQRLLREFLAEHLADGRALRAFDVWERDAWTRPDPASGVGA